MNNGEQIINVAGDDLQGAPRFAHRGDPCENCGTAHDKVAVGPCPGPRFGDRLRAVLANDRGLPVKVHGGRAAEIAAEIDADRDRAAASAISAIRELHDELTSTREGEARLLRQRIEEAVERLRFRADFGPGEGLVSVPGEDYGGQAVVPHEELLAALAEIFEGRPADGPADGDATGGGR
jgi:hypothetical protein